MNTKQCSKCGYEQLITEFYKRTNRIGYIPVCKTCYKNVYYSAMIDCLYCKKSIRKSKKERHQRECFKKYAVFEKNVPTCPNLRFPFSEF
jgi:hypothetical protein